MVGRNVLLVKDSQGEGYRTFQVPSPRLWVSGSPPAFRTARGAPSTRWPIFIWRFPTKPEVKLSSVGSPNKAPACLRNWSQTPSQGSDSCGNTRFLRRRGGSAFCLWNLANVKSSHKKPVTNTKFFWKAIFRVTLKPKYSFTIRFSLCSQMEGKGKIKRTARCGLKERICWDAFKISL